MPVIVDQGKAGQLERVFKIFMTLLARVFLVNPSVIVLDEASAVIDIPSERAVQNAMRAVFRGRTALVIAHRPSTIQVSDRVLVLADGRVIEDCAPEVLA